MNQYRIIEHNITGLNGMDHKHFWVEKKWHFLWVSLDGTLYSSYARAIAAINRHRYPEADKYHYID